MSSIAIIGSGIVGLCCAIELLRTGHSVTLFDRSEPCSEASQWNAGVLATSSLMPLNNPSLFAKIPSLLSGKSPGFRLNYGASLKTLPWALKFLANGRYAKFKQTVYDLHQLIEFSRRRHESLLAELNSSQSLKRNGWLYLYKSEKSFRGSRLLVRTLEQYNVDYELLKNEELKNLEPALKQHFHQAIHLKDTFSANPNEINKLYQAHIRNLGGSFKREDIHTIRKSKNGLCLTSWKDEYNEFDHVVIASGPWSEDLTRQLGVTLPMAVERGYIQTYSLKDDAVLNRPIYDVDHGYVASPRPNGIQISSGTELTTLASLPNYNQINKAAEKVKTVLPIQAATRNSPVVGNRPTLIDSKPAIGPVKGYPGLWLACGHQHIGFATSAGTGHLLASLINRAEPAIDCVPFLPSRFDI